MSKLVETLIDTPIYKIHKYPGLHGTALYIMYIYDIDNAKSIILSVKRKFQITKIYFNNKSNEKKYKKKHYKIIYKRILGVYRTQYYYNYSSIGIMKAKELGYFFVE